MPAPKRPQRPNSKGLHGGQTIEVKFRPDALRDLRQRARYETTRYRLAHDGKGHIITPHDIIRRIVDEYFEKVSALPADGVGSALRAAGRRA